MEKWILSQVVLLALPLCLLMGTAQVAEAQLHQDVFPDLEGQALLDALENAYKPAFTLGNSASKDTLYAVIYRLPGDSLRGVYTGYTIHLPQGEDPSQAAFAQDINLEHTYPKSQGAAGGQQESDMHHLFPTRVEVNADRGSLPFGESPDDQTTKWYYQTLEQSNIPSSNIDAWSELLENSLFEPREDHKGNVARAMFYFYTMYRDAADQANPDFFEEQRATLCQWHALDPVDSLEWERTFLIAHYQDDKPNPFVLDCTLAARSYCSEFDLPCLTANENPQLPPGFSWKGLSPNPADDELQWRFHLDEPLHLQATLLNVFGAPLARLIDKQLPAGAYAERLDVSQLPPGIYYLRLLVETDGGVYLHVERVVVF